jgi:predicted  nucleic acid-binding Zn-ribbon protein
LPSATESGGEEAPNSRQSQQRGLKKEPLFGSSPARNGISAHKESSSSPKTKATTKAREESIIDQYPVARLVLDLEKREQQAQGKYDSLKKKYRELDAALELSNKEREKEKSVVEADYRHFQDALTAATNELKKERKRADNVRTENESLSADIAAYENTIEALEEELCIAEADVEEIKTAQIALRKELAAEKHKASQESKSIQSIEHEALQRQLEQEQNKAKELRATNESLVSVLEAQAQEKNLLARMLEEKTYESWIFRCAVGVIYKDSPSNERVKMGKLIRDVIMYLCEKRRRERLVEQQAGDDDDNDDDDDGSSQKEDGDGQDEEQEQEREQGEVEAAPQHGQPGLEMTDARDSGLDSEDLPLSERATRSKRHRSLQRTDYSDYFATSDDTDDEKPLVEVLKKRAKKLKTTSSHDEASSVA